MNKGFVSIRWKLVSTYLLLVFLTLSLMISFINETLKINFLEDKRVSLMTQANIVSGQIASNFGAIDKPNTKNYLKKLIEKHSLEINSRIVVVDRSSTVILDSYREFEGKTLEIKELNKALEGEIASDLYKLDSDERAMYVSVPITSSKTIVGAVLISSTVEQVFQKSWDVIEKVLLLSLLGLLITGIVSFIFADIISSPLEKITDLVKHITRGNFDQKIETEGDDELANLSSAINIMASKLNQIDDQRKKFVSNVSHELRTPLASIKIMSESLLATSQLDEAITREFLQDIDTEVDRLNRIIDSLLYLVDIEKKDMLLEYSYNNLNEMIRSVLRQLLPLANKKNIHIKYYETDSIKLNCDQDKLRQAMINIVGNAIKYTSNGGRVLIEMYRERDLVLIKVRDNGIGIPEKDLDNIFDRFYRVDEARARSTGGSGLGLSIAQQIIHLHQGEIKVESQVNQGTIMTIILPGEINI